MTRRQGVAAAAGMVSAATVFGFAIVPGHAADVAAPGPPRAPAAVEPPPVEPPVAPSPAPVIAAPLRTGSRGAQVAALQQRLVDLQLDPDPTTGTYDGRTQFAVIAFQKLAGIEPSGAVDVATATALATFRTPPPLLPGGGADRIEIDLPRQLLFVYTDGRLRLVTHVSTGSGRRFCVDGDCQMAITPPGSWRVIWRYRGWRESRLGRLYDPVYITNDGVAIHGFGSVPMSPASHGCVRVPMYVADELFDMVHEGEPVYVFDGTRTPVPLPPLPAGDARTPPHDAPRPAPAPQRRPLLDGDVPAATTSTTGPARTLV